MRTILHRYFTLILCCICLNTSVFGLEVVKVEFAIPFQKQAGPNTVIIPFTLKGGLILINARIGEEYGSYIFDTGAKGLVLNANYIRPDRLLDGVQGVGISGGMRIGAKRLEAFNLEELSFPGIVANTVDLAHLEKNKKMRIHGLIGYDVLKDFEIMINYKEKHLTFSRLDDEGNMIDALPHTLDKIDSIQFTLAKFIPVINVRVKGIQKQMGIDTGAEYNLLDMKRSKDILEHFKVLKQTKVVAANDRKIEVLGGKLYGLSFLKKYKNPGMHSVLTNFHQMDKLYQMRLDGILGYPFLMRWTTSFNYKKRKIYIHRPKFVKP